MYIHIYILYLYKYTIIYIHALSIIYSDIPSWGAMPRKHLRFRFPESPRASPYLLQLPDFEARADHALLRVNPRRQMAFNGEQKNISNKHKIIWPSGIGPEILWAGDSFNHHWFTCRTMLTHAKLLSPTPFHVTFSSNHLNNKGESEQKTRSV